jgi:UDP-N-acetylglucosamine 2-epimerase
MSYDVYLEGPTCPACKNKAAGPDGLPGPTYNLTPIFDLALTGSGLPNQDVPEAEVVLFGKRTDRPRGLRLLNAMTGKESEAILSAAAHRLHDPDMESRFRKLEPTNKWGTLEAAQQVVDDLRRAAIDYPNHIWRVQ